MEQLLLVTSCDSPAGIGASLRTDARMHGRTDGWTDRHDVGNSILDMRRAPQSFKNFKSCLLTFCTKFFFNFGNIIVMALLPQYGNCCKRIRMELEIGHPEHFVLRMTDLSSIRILCQQPFSKKSELLCSCARLKLSKEILCSNIAKMITMDDDIILSVLG